MPRTAQVAQACDDDTVNIALDTLAHAKQALVFCSTKRGAESLAEKIAHKTKETNGQLEDLARRILSAVSSPTKQCHRLAACVRKGIAFHHAGLTGGQRELVETSFREGTIRIITATPTLAMGMDLPAYRSVIRDLKRFSSGTSWGMADIPVLEYEQMAGRAGRPGKEDVGEAICIAKDEDDKERIVEKYLRGAPEEISSKLAVEPVLRTYVLSLIASGYVHGTQTLYAFFDETFYAFQYGDTRRLHGILDRMVALLREWGFVEGEPGARGDFVSAAELAGASDGALVATPLGERVAKLYLDPFTAHRLLGAIEDALAQGRALGELPMLHLLAGTLEMRPVPNVRQGEVEAMDRLLISCERDLLVPAPGLYSDGYDEFLSALKLALVLQGWIEELGEDALLERYGVTPGELQAKRSIADWLLYSLVELSKLMRWHPIIAGLERLRVRIEHGAKEELLALLRLSGIGRVRARKLYANGVRGIEDVKRVEYSTLRALLGEKTAASVKEQVGEKVLEADLAVKPHKRKGQVSLGDFEKK